MKQIVSLINFTFYGREYKAGTVFKVITTDHYNFCIAEDHLKNTVGLFENEYEEYQPSLENK